MTTLYTAQPAATVRRAAVIGGALMTGALGLAFALHSLSPQSVAARSPGRLRLGVAHVDVMDFHLERLPDQPPRHREVFTAPELAARYARAHELGVGWHRWSLNWDLVIRGGNYDFVVPDGIAGRDVQAGLRTLAVLHGVPPGERSYVAAPPSLAFPIFRRADGGLTDDPGLAVAINDQNLWGDFVARVVGRYKPGGELARARGWGPGVGVRTWEMGNEPNLKGFWPGSAADFVRFLEVSYLAAKWVDPGATVVHGGIADHGNSTWWYTQFAEALRARAGASPLPARYNYYFDKAAWHWYQPAATLITPPAKARSILRDHGLPVKPLWVTETGLSIWSEYPGPCWAGPSPGRGTLEDQAGFVQGILGELGRSGIEVMIFFQLYDDCGNGPTSYDAFGLVRNSMGQECFTAPGHACWSPDPAKAGQPRPAFFLVKAAAGGAMPAALESAQSDTDRDDLGDRAGDPALGRGVPGSFDMAPPAEVLIAAPEVAEANFTVQVMAGDSSGLGAYQLFFTRGAPPAGATGWQAAGPPRPWPGRAAEWPGGGALPGDRRPDLLFRRPSGRSLRQLERPAAYADGCDAYRRLGGPQRCLGGRGAAQSRGRADERPLQFRRAPVLAPGDGWPR